MCYTLLFTMPHCSKLDYNSTPGLHAYYQHCCHLSECQTPMRHNHTHKKESCDTFKKRLIDLLCVLVPTRYATLHDLTWQKSNAEDPLLWMDLPPTPDAPLGQDDSLLRPLSRRGSAHLWPPKKKDPAGSLDFLPLVYKPKQRNKGFSSPSLSLPPPFCRLSLSFFLFLSSQ